MQSNLFSSARSLLQIFLLGFDVINLDDVNICSLYPVLLFDLLYLKRI